MIGTLGTFSGESAKPQLEVVRGVELAIRQYNRDPQSTYEVKLQREDTKGTPNGITQSATNLSAAELLIGVVGPFTVDEIELAGPLFEQTRTPFLVPNVTSGEPSSHGWTTLRRLVADDRREGEAVASEILRKTKKVGLVHDGSAHGGEFAEGAKALLEGAGATPKVVEIPARPGKNDWNAAVTAVSEAGPEVVVFSGPPDKTGTLIANLRTAGFKGRYYTSHESRQQSFGDAAGGGAVGALSACVCADPSDPRLQDFSLAFRRAFNQAPAPFAAEAYEATLMLLEAVEEVEPRRQSVLEFLRSSPVFRGDTKRYEFQPSGDLSSPTIWLYEWKDGKWRSVGPTRPRASTGRE